MDIRLIALDLDGTLLDPGTSIHPDTIATLERFVDHGGLVAINTGRPYNAILDIMQKNDVLPNCRFPHALIAEEREIYLRQPNSVFESHEPWNTSIIESETSAMPVARHIVQSVEAILAQEAIVPREPNTALEDERGFVERYFKTQEAAERARIVAHEHLPHGIPLQAIRNSALLALRHKEVGKGKLLLRLASLLNVAPNHIFAVGDSHNDLEMLDGKLGFASGTIANADEQIKEIVRKNGGPVATQPRSLGVAELVRQLLPNEGQE